MKRKAPCSDLRVMIVDDNVDARTTLSEILSFDGYSVTSCGSLEEARQELQKRSFMAVILDLQLPDGQGLDILRTIDHADRNPEIIVITGHPSLESSLLSINKGVFSYFEKPVDVDQLKGSLREISDNYRDKQKNKRIRAKLRSMSLKDSHTGLYNHRYLLERLQKELLRSERTKSPLSILMIDLDNFKAVNDTYGHQRGDVLLKKTGRLLAGTLRGNDVVTRYGGDEFVVIMPDTGKEEAGSVAERILKEMRECRFLSGRKRIDLRCSIGSASFPEDGGSEANKMIEKADKQMIKAKNSGGDAFSVSKQDHGQAQSIVSKEKKTVTNENTYGVLFDLIPVSILVHNAESGEVIAANREALQSYGISSLEDMKEENIWLDPPYSHRDALKWIHRARDKGEQVFEWMSGKVSGEKFWEKVFLKKTAMKGEETIMAISVDITAMKKANEALNRERDQLLSIFNSMDEMVYISDPLTYEVIYVNKKLSETLKKNCIGDKCYEAFQGMDSPCPFCTNEIILLRKPKPHRWEYYNPALKKHFSIVDRIIKWPDGRDVRLEIAGDITDSKKAENELRDYRVHLEDLVEERTKKIEDFQAKISMNEKLASLGKLTEIVAHELRNPLGAMKNASYALRTVLGNKIDKMSDKYIKIIDDDILLLESVINDILVYGGIKPPQKKRFDIREYIKQCLENMNIPENIVVDRSFKEENLFIFADEKQLGHVFRNIASNAFHAMPEGGELKIRADRNSDDVIISFKDTGQGISEKNISSIFVPGFSTKPHGEGVGLGLSICESIIKLHEGKIDVVSAEGKGTEFVITLPGPVT